MKLFMVEENPIKDILLVIYNRLYLFTIANLTYTVIGERGPMYLSLIFLACSSVGKSTGLISRMS